MKTLKDIIEITEKQSIAFMATADSDGNPYVTKVENIALVHHDCLKITSWFCPKTMENLMETRNISLVIWHVYQDVGFQLLGGVEKMEEAALLDGYAPEMEEKMPIPQIQWQLLVRVDRIGEIKQNRQMVFEA